MNHHLYAWGSYGMESSSSLNLRDAYAEKVKTNTQLMRMITSKGTLGKFIFMMIEFSCAREKLNTVEK